MPGFVMIPDEVRLDAKVSDSALRVYAVLAAQARATKTRKCQEIGVNLLARLAMCSRNTAKKALADLARQKHIRVERVSPRTRATYYMESKWFMPKALRSPIKQREETIFENESLVLKRKGRGKKGAEYTPRQYEIKEMAG